MIHKKINKKAHQLSTILVVVALIMSVFAVGLYTGSNSNSVIDNNQNNNENLVTGAVTGMEKVSGMQVATSNKNVVIFSATSRSIWTFDDATFNWDGKEWKVSLSGLGQQDYPAKDIAKLYHINKEVISKATELVEKGDPNPPAPTPPPPAAAPAPSPSAAAQTATAASDTPKYVTTVKIGSTPTVIPLKATTMIQAQEEVNNIKKTLGQGVIVESPKEASTQVTVGKPSTKPIGTLVGVFNDNGKLEGIYTEAEAKEKLKELQESFEKKQNVLQGWENYKKSNEAALKAGLSEQSLKQDYLQNVFAGDKDYAAGVLVITSLKGADAKKQVQDINPLAITDASGTTTGRYSVGNDIITGEDKAWVKANELNAKNKGYSSTEFFTLNDAAILKKGQKFYRAKNNELGFEEITGDAIVVKPIKVGNVFFDEFYDFKDGDIKTETIKMVNIRKDKELLVKNIPLESYDEIKAAVSSAKKESLKIEEGAFTLDNPFLVSDGDGIKLRTFKTSISYSYDTQSEVTVSEKNFVKIDDGIKPLEITHVGKNGDLRIIEKNEIVKIDTGQKNAKGEPIKKEIIETKEYVGVDTERNEKFTREMLKNEKGRQTGDYIQDVTDLKTGEPKFSVVAVGQTGRFRIEYRDDGVSVNDKKYEVFIKEHGDNPDLIKLVSSRRYFHAQFTSREFFAQLESILTEFKGLGYYATFFFAKEDLDKWRESVDKTFATLYLGTEYWTSDICIAYTDIDRSSQGIAYVDTKLGLAAVAAHIEATRSEQLISPGTVDNKTGIIKPTSEFLYKITFNVKNGDYKSDPKALEIMRFNVVLKGSRTAKLFKNDIEVEKGDQLGHIGRSAIVQYSNSFYDDICIEFETTPSSWNLEDDELCNTIAGPSGPTSAGGGQQQPAQQETAGEGNVNDI